MFAVALLVLFQVFYLKFQVYFTAELPVLQKKEIDGPIHATECTYWWSLEAFLGLHAFSSLIVRWIH